MTCQILSTSLLLSCNLLFFFPLNTPEAHIHIWNLVLPQSSLQVNAIHSSHKPIFIEHLVYAMQYSRSWPYSSTQDRQESICPVQHFNQDPLMHTGLFLFFFSITINATVNNLKCIFIVHCTDVFLGPFPRSRSNLFSQVSVTVL